MKTSLVLVIGLIVFGLSGSLAAQEDSRTSPPPIKQIPLSSHESPSDKASSSHPDQIRLQLRALKAHFEAAGLADEARLMGDLEQRVRDKYADQLLAAHLKGFQNVAQVRLRIQFVTFQHCEETSAAIAEFRAAMIDKEVADQPRNTLLGVHASEPTEKLMACIKRLQDNGLAHMTSSPAVTVLDGRMAQVINGTNVPVPGREQPAAPTIPVEPAVAVDVLDGNMRFVGTRLQVTPTIEEDDSMRLVVQATQSTLDSRRRTQSTVLVRKNESLILGGYQTTGHATEISRIPVLGDIPLVGTLFFSSKRLRKEVTEEVIVVTPERFEPPAEIASPAQPDPSPIQPAKFSPSQK